MLLDAVVCMQLLLTFANSGTQIRPDKTSGLIWIQTVCHSDDIPDFFFENIDFDNNQQTAKMQNYPACKLLKGQLDL